MSLSEVTVSREALLFNLRQFRGLPGGQRILSVVKSEAYGHGLTNVARAIESAVDYLGTVSLDEALRLREAGIKKPVIVLSFYELDRVGDAIKNGVSLVVYDLKQADAIDRAAAKLKVRAPVHLKVDTGTSRLGVLSDEFPLFAQAVARRKNLAIEGLMSHFSSSEEDLAYTRRQLALFEKAYAELASRGIAPGLKHIACTAAGLELPESRDNLMRVGLGTYGLWPSEQTRKKTLSLLPDFRLKPALTWRTRIIQVKNLPKGSPVGYGKTFVTKRPTRLAVLPVGYFDGYDRKLSNRGSVLIGGKRCPVLGRICMNLTMVDVTAVKSARTSDEAVLLGRQGREEVSAEEMAGHIGTINYEVVTRINPSVPRKMVK